MCVPKLFGTLPWLGTVLNYYACLFVCCIKVIHRCVYAGGFFAYRTNEPSKQPLGLEDTYSKKKLSVKRSKGIKTEAKANTKAYQEEKMSGKQKLI